MNVLLKLLPAAILGTVISYFIINWFIVPISFLGYLGIEATITLFHSLYNVLKEQLS
jgi:hypothetical protein